LGALASAAYFTPRWSSSSFIGSGRLASPSSADSHRGRYVALALGPVWWLAPFATVTIGLGFYMLHNTLQTNATQMTPQARATAVAIFSSGDLYRANRGRRRRGGPDRSFGYPAAVPRRRGNHTYPGNLVRAPTAPPPSGISRTARSRRIRPQTLTSGTFGTVPRRGGRSATAGTTGGLRRGDARRFLARRGSGNFSARGVTGPSG